MLKAVLFDLDATLINRSASLEPLLRSIYERFSLDKQHVLFDAFYQRFLALTNFGYTPGEVVYQTLVTEFSLNISAQIIVDDHRAQIGSHSVTFPGTYETLAALRTQGYLLGIITNGSTLSQSSKITNCELDKLVDTILISQSVGISKPNHAIFQLAAKRLDVECCECMFVGDHPTNDVAGAQNAGMLGVWLKGDIAWPDDLDLKPNFKISAINELMPIVDSVGKS